MSNFPGAGTWLSIFPKSFDEPQRVEAVRQATEMGLGVRMEVGNYSTSFYATADVPVGHIEVWMARTYSGQLELATVLSRPEEPFQAWGFNWKKPVSDAMKAAILSAAEATQASARERYRDAPNVLASVDQTVQMLYEIQLAQFESGHMNPMLAVAWDEGYGSDEEVWMPRTNPYKRN